MRDIIYVWLSINKLKQFGYLERTVISWLYSWFLVQCDL